MSQVETVNRTPRGEICGCLAWRLTRVGGVGTLVGMKVFNALIIFVAGMLVYHLFFARNQSLQVSKEIERENSRAAQKPFKLENVVAKQVAVKPEGLKVKETPPAENKVQRSVAQRVSLDLTEETVQKMEDIWNDLPLLAEARRESRGWRMTRIQENSIFFKAGFRAGDLITDEFLKQLQIGQETLAFRTQQILNRITR